MDNQNYSIFDDPKNHAESKKRVSKTVLLTVCIVVVALIGGLAIAANKLLPEETEQTDDSALFGSFSVVEISADTVASVTVENKNGSFEFKPQTKTVESDSDSYETTVWYVTGVEGELTDTTLTESIIKAATSVTAMREITEKTAADCGFNEPYCQATVITNDSKAYTLLIGDESPDGFGVYIKVADSDKIYLADSSVLSSFEFAEEDLLAGSNNP